MTFEGDEDSWSVDKNDGGDELTRSIGVSCWFGTGRRFGIVLLSTGRGTFDSCLAADGESSKKVPGSCRYVDSSGDGRYSGVRSIC